MSAWQDGNDAEIIRRVQEGWRPSRCIPLDDVYMVGRFGYDDEEAIKTAISRVRDHTMVSFERLASLWQQVDYLDRFEVPGALVECGVWKGGTVGMMALAHLRSAVRPIRHLHLLDSFEGLPEPRADVDGSSAADYAGGHDTGSLRSIGRCVSPLDDSRRLLEQQIGYPVDLVHYHVGWFEETLPRDAAVIGRIALLRLDGDWYESTRVCLEHLYSNVVCGGVVVIDDYGHWEGCRRAVDEFTAARGEPILLNHLDYTGRFWVKLS